VTTLIWALLGLIAVAHALLDLRAPAIAAGATWALVGLPVGAALLADTLAAAYERRRERARCAAIVQAEIDATWRAMDDGESFRRRVLVKIATAIREGTRPE
jgi:hypothetical protein